MFTASTYDLKDIFKGRHVIIVRVGHIERISLFVKITVKKHASFFRIKTRGAVALGLDVFQIGFIHGDDVIKIGKIVARKLSSMVSEGNAIISRDTARATVGEGTNMITMRTSRITRNAI